MPAARKLGKRAAPPRVSGPDYFSFLFSVSIRSLAAAGRGRILAGDQLAIGHRMNAPVLDLGKGSAEPHHFVLDKEGHHLRQSYLVFLAIGEARHGLAFDKQLAIRGSDVVQRAG
jgi:hypothetical protein